ncbi:MAG TPA: plasmid pRiA4b ORF-3 family protein [Polyangiaceae bacterium]
MLHQLKVTLEGLKPAIWRRVVVPSEFTLFDLHVVIQVAMGWENCHLHDFTIGRRQYALPDPDGFDHSLNEADVTLAEVAGPRSKFKYQYDFGDSWIHVILVEKILDNLEVPFPSCTGGARACPPEDSGGAWGYEEKLEALADPDDEAGEELREWMGEDFDPERFEIDAVNRGLLAAFRPVSRKKKRSTRSK